MLERIHPSPDNILAFSARQKVTDEDYKSMLIPSVENQIKANGKVRFVYLIGPEFEGFEAKAALDDALLGLHHWRDFERVAIVTDKDWIANTMRIFLPLMPAKAKLFNINQLQDALNWAAA